MNDGTQVFPCQVRDLHPEHVQRFYNDKTQKGFSVRTIRDCHTLLYGALSQAEKNQLVVKNVVALVEPPRKERKEKPTLSQEQVAGQPLPGIANDRLAAAIFLLFGTGLRWGEVLGLRWQDVDFEEAITRSTNTRPYTAPQRGKGCPQNPSRVPEAKDRSIPSYHSYPSYMPQHSPEA